MAKRMKAAVVREFGKPLKIEEVPIPTPGFGEVLVKVIVNVRRRFLVLILGTSSKRVASSPGNASRSTAPFDTGSFLDRELLLGDRVRQAGSDKVAACAAHAEINAWPLHVRHGKVTVRRMRRSPWTGQQTCTAAKVVWPGTPNRGAVRASPCATRNRAGGKIRPATVREERDAHVHEDHPRADPPRHEEGIRGRLQARRRRSDTWAAGALPGFGYE